ncbi:hypothetical protein OEB96_05950 [Paraliomyxa miuraensis]|nr:hypothetical protein [Paraliomyxa miuraensis]
MLLSLLSLPLLLSSVSVPPLLDPLEDSPIKHSPLSSTVLRPPHAL